MSAVRNSWTGTAARLIVYLAVVSTVSATTALALGHARPNNGMITFVSPTTFSTSVLYGLDVDTGLQTRLVAGNSYIECAIWSPDGKSVALAAPGLAGTLPQTLDSVGGLRFYQMPTSVFTWSPDSRRLLLEVYFNYQLDMYLMDVASGELRNLTSNHDAPALQHIWAPDARQVVFYSPSSNGLDVYAQGVDGRGLYHVASFYAMYIELLGWRIDSREVVLQVEDQGTSRFYTLDVDNNDSLVQLTEPGQFSYTQLSPNRDRLAFSGLIVGLEEPSVYMLELGGEPPHSIYTASPIGAIGDVRWSPEGMQLAFVSLEWGSITPENEALYLFDTNGSEPRLLTSAIDGFSPLIWSPDGRQIAFRSDSMADPDGELPGLAFNELYTIDVESGELRRLTYGLGVAGCFAWIP